MAENNNCSFYPSKNHTTCPSSVECFHAVWFKGYGREGTANPNEVVSQSKTGAWFIEMGFAGFNSNANNLDGYKTKDRAIAAVVRYQNKSA